MAIKDVSISEDTEHNKPSGEESVIPQKPVENGESSQIKNAHAVGDGSYGRNDENEVEKNEGNVEKEDNNY